MTSSTNTFTPGFQPENNDRLIDTLDEIMPSKSGKLSSRVRLEDVLEEKRLARELSESYFYD